MLDRRALLGLLAGTAAGRPRSVSAQGLEKVRRVGVLVVGGSTADMVGPKPANPYVAALIEGLSESGWYYEQNLKILPRGGEGHVERYPALVAELVSMNPDAIVAPGPMLIHLKQATSSIPIVMSAADDPIRDRFTESLARPTANFTGLSWQSAEIVGKRMELFRELVPGNGLIGVIWDEESKSSWLAAEAAAKARGWQLLSLEINRAEELETIFKTAIQSHADGILVYAAGLLFARRAHVAKLAAESRLPAMYHLKPYVEDGGLIAYSADLVDGWRRAASYVDKLLRGAKPADLPIQQPTKIELVVNLKAAKDLGLNVPQSILLRANEIIQ